MTILESIGNLKELHMDVFVCSITDYPIHRHDGFEIIFVLEGSVRIKASSFHYTLAKGDIFFINYNEIHSIYSEEENVVLLFQVDPYHYLNYFPNLSYYIIVCDSYASSGRDSKALKQSRFLLTQIMLMAHRENSSPEDIKGMIIELIQIFVEEYSFFTVDELGYHNNSSFKNNAIQTERVFQIQKYIFQSYEQKITLDDVANHVNLDKYYVSHIIKTSTGLNFQELRNLFRSELSERMLLETELSLENIALSCGFSDVKYYRRSFMRWFGKDPKTYRQTYRHYAEGSIKKQRRLEKEEYEEYLRAYTTEKALLPLADGGAAKASGDSHGIDFSMAGRPFPHFWENDIYISNALDGANNIRTILTAREDFQFKEIRIAEVFESLLNEDRDKRYLYDYMLNFLHAMIKNAIKTTLLISPVAYTHQDIGKVVCDFLSRYTTTHEPSELAGLGFSLLLPEGISRPLSDRGLIAQFKERVGPRAEQLSVKCEEHTRINFRYEHDSVLMSPFLIYTVLNQGPAGYLKEYRQLFDQRSENKEKDVIFGGQSGMITADGLKKPSYYTWKFLSLLGDEILLNENGVVVTRKEENLAVLIYDYKNIITGRYKNRTVPYTLENDLGTYGITLELSNVKQDYTVARWELDYKNSALKYWEDMGAPSVINAYERNLINQATCPKVAISHLKKTPEQKFFLTCRPYCTELWLFTARKF